MCTNLKVINNNAKRYRPLFSRGQLAVPCGSCPECISQSQDDWFLRTWQEVKSYLDDGGRVVFATFTYKNSCLPIFTDVDIDEETGEIKSYQIPCFRKSDKDRYINSLLKFFERKRVTGDNSKGIRYIWVSEYGESEGSTHRPHYHPLIFFPKECISKDVLGFDPDDEQSWKEFLASYWTFGMTRWSKPEDGGIFVNSEFAARYVTKYITKDFEWYNQPQLTEYLYDSKGKVIPDRYQKIKRYLPKHWQSKSFGLDLIDFCHNRAVFRDGLDLRFVADLKKGKRKIYKVPRYIERKLLYEVDEFGSLVLNEEGKKVKGQLLSFDFKLANLVKHNVDYIEFVRLNTSNSLDPRDGTNFDFVQSYLKGKSVEYYSAWQLAFSGTCFDQFDPYTYSKFVRMSDEDFINYCRDLYNLRIQGYRDDDQVFDEAFTFYFNNSMLHYHMPEEYPLFESFSKFNALLLSYRHKESLLSYNEYLRKKRERKRTKLHIA